MLAATIDLIKMSPLDINNALAYIDPGSGSAIISAIIGVFVAIGIAVKTERTKSARRLKQPENRGIRNSLRSCYLVGGTYAHILYFVQLMGIAKNADSFIEVER